ncbi:Bifunctional dihydrofolate reductase-thymidylate synthase [Frankliniella fusca]|uniref:Bifunctional dihydrofolate reductase-thymidylate synthase n=1 Tax=Frankliniella fusca TaxID=407009 RepID=A0AAE1HCI4_9NEOP|nr:Bifunctional dihydrofolate reductase-thymidylate synthase [Frankliniella fusca]
MSHIGGGVAIYVRNTLRVKVLAQSAPSLLREQKPDFLILEISVSNINILFATVYRPPKAGHLSVFQDELFSFCIDYEHVFVSGDVNAHFGSDKPCDIMDGKGVQELLDTCNLVRVPFNATFHTGTCDSALDMIATTCINKLTQFMQTPVCGLSAHDLLYAVFSFKVPKPPPETFSRRDFSHFNMEQFKTEILAAPWDRMLDSPEIDAKLLVFNQLLLELYDRHAPLRVHYVKRYPKPWISSELILLMNQRDQAYRRSRRTKLSCDISIYKKLRNHVNKVKRDAKVNYAYSVFNNAKSSKEMWDALKKVDPMF